jgi:hypothetical protein
MSTTESLLVITDEVAKITMLLIPKWSRDSCQNRIDVVPLGEHRDSGGEGGRKKELEQASWITLT